MSRELQSAPIVPGAKGRRKIFLARFRSFASAICLAICLLAAWVGKQLGLDPNLIILFVLISATVATLVAVGQRLPLQNIVGLAVTTTLFSGVVYLVEKVFGMSFTPVLNEEFHSLPAWTAPLLWTISLVNARGIGKLFLQKIRRTKNFGLWLLGLSSLLAASLNRGGPLQWQIFVGQMILALLAFVATTPWFIDKKPVDHPPDAQPLFLILFILLW